MYLMNNNEQLRKDLVRTVTYVGLSLMLIPNFIVFALDDGQWTPSESATFYAVIVIYYTGITSQRVGQASDATDQSCARV